MPPTTLSHSLGIIQLLSTVMNCLENRKNIPKKP